MIRIFTGVQFILSVMMTLAVWLAPQLGMVPANNPAAVSEAMGMVDFMWLLTLIFVLISLAKHEKKRTDDDRKSSRNY